MCYCAIVISVKFHDIPCTGASLVGQVVEAVVVVAMETQVPQAPADVIHVDRAVGVLLVPQHLEWRVGKVGGGGVEKGDGDEGVEGWKREVEG